MGWLQKTFSVQLILNYESHETNIDTSSSSLCTGLWDERVDIQLNVRISRTPDLHSITGILVIQPVRLLPRIWDAISIRILGLRPASNIPWPVHRTCFLITNQLSGFAIALNFSDELFVDGVPGGKYGANIGDNPGYCIAWCEEIAGAGICVGGTTNIHITVAGGFHAKGGAV